jgi:glucokinase
MYSNIVTGIDIGGSHITAALIDLDAHAIIPGSTIRRDIDSKGNAKSIIKEWTDAILLCKDHHPQASDRLGIAIPGPFDYNTGISGITGLDKYEALYHLNVKDLIAAALGIRAGDVYMMNDASCFLKGEVFAGAAQSGGNVIGITLGTGLGSAVFKDGSIIDGDLYCTPYKEGTAEDYLSTRWFIKAYKERTGKAAKNVKEIRNSIQRDETAASLFTEFGANLGAVLSSYAKRYGADKVVVGGNIINAWELFIPETEKVLGQHSVFVSVVKAELGEEAALLGAGSLCN